MTGNAVKVTGLHEFKNKSRAIHCVHKNNNNSEIILKLFLAVTTATVRLSGFRSQLVVSYVDVSL